MLDFDVIRPAEAEDEEMINEFFSVMGGESRGFFNRGDGNRRGFLSYIKDKPDSVRYWIGIIDGKMAGMVFLWDLNTSIPWMGIAVREEYKGQHLGRRLVAFVQDYVRKLGKGGIQLTTHVPNIRGQGLYEAMGFEKIGTHGASGEFYYIYRFRDKD